MVGENPDQLFDPPVVKGLPSTLEQAIELAYRNNPGLKAAEADLQAAISARKQTSGAFHPRLDLEVGATRNEDIDGTVSDNDDETAVVRMSYNLFRGDGDRARMNEAQAREFAARETVRSVRRAVE